MSQLKEKEGKYFKECNIVMLPTEDRTSIIINTKSNIEYRPDLINDKMLRSAITFQHLYITSDDEIKEGDWYINSANKRNYINRSGNTKFDSLYDNCKKIIATTDKSLMITKQNGNLGQAIINLPEPSQSFIKKYCELGGIDKVLVEYKLCNFVCEKGAGTSDCRKQCVLPELKTDSHNTIIIKPVKNSWTREEVEKLYRQGRIEAYTQTKAGFLLEEISDLSDRILKEL